MLGHPVSKLIAPPKHSVKMPAINQQREIALTLEQLKSSQGSQQAQKLYDDICQFYCNTSAYFDYLRSQNGSNPIDIEINRGLVQELVKEAQQAAIEKGAISTALPFAVSP